VIAIFDTVKEFEVPEYYFLLYAYIVGAVDVE
jgi:hypothetical protein